MRDITDDKQWGKITAHGTPLKKRWKSQVDGDVVDRLATDVYTQRYDQDNDKQLQALAEGRPIGQHN